MIFEPAGLEGACIVTGESHGDERGWFMRTFCAEEFRRHGLDPTVAQCSVSHNARAGTLRGMHYQAEPHAEAKLVRCTRGAIYDVILDLRPQSPTFRCWEAVKLSAAEVRLIFVPKGVAHGFQTLKDGTEVFYQISSPYVPSHSRGVRWDDPAFRIDWPDADRVISERDRTYPDFAS